MPTDADRIAALEEQVAQLAAAAAAPAFAPLSGMKVDPAGRVSFDFDGHVHAKGVDLDAADALALIGNENRVQWIQLPGGAVAADLAGVRETFDAGPPFGLVTRDMLTASARAVDPGGPDARLQLTANDLPGAAVIAGAGAAEVTVINADSQSSFLRLAAVADRRIAFGKGLATFPGSSNSNAAIVTHGLNRAPLLALVAGQDSGTPAIVSAWGVTPSGTNQIVVRGKTADGGAIGPGDVEFWWLVIA